jgi:hypothetical protein
MVSKDIFADPRQEDNWRRAAGGTSDPQRISAFGGKNAAMD